jgi:hypothetical protein
MKAAIVYANAAEQEMANAEQYDYGDAATAIHLMRAQINATLAVAASVEEWEVN